MAEEAEEQRQEEQRAKADQEWKEQVQEEQERLKQKEGRARPAGAAAGETRQNFPEPSIPVFMAGLYTQTLIALGDIEDPVSGRKEPNLAEAEYLIDTVAMLAEKTGGNLEGEEETYVQNVLSDLRMRYVNASRSEQESPEPEQSED